MTRAHAARRLLALGPLTLAEFVEITGWPYRQCVRLLEYLCDRGEVQHERCGVYEVMR